MRMTGRGSALTEKRISREKGESWGVAVTAEEEATSFVSRDRDLADVVRGVAVAVVAVDGGGVALLLSVSCFP